MKTILKKIEIFLRHAVVYPFMRLCLRNPVRNGKIDLQSVKKLLILRNDRIGDMIVSTPVFRKLKEMNPHLTLGVFASPGNAEIIRHNPFVNELFIAHSHAWKLWKELRRCKAKRFDVVLNFIFNKTTSQGLIANYVAPQAYKVGQGSNKYQMYFNRLLTLDRTEIHMVDILIKFVDEIFGISSENEPRRPEIFIPDSTHEKVDVFLNHNKLRRRGNAGTSGSYAVINFSAIDIMRQVSAEQVIQIVKAINGWRHDLPVIINPPGGHEKLRHIREGLDSKEVKIYPPSGSATLLEIASLIKGARYVVTCDTAVVHFASAVKTPVFVLFTPTVASLNHEWKPYGVVNKCLYAIKGLGVDAIPSGKIVTELSIFESGQFLSKL